MPNLQGFEYTVDVNGNALFRTQPFPINPKIMMQCFVLEPHDSVCFFKGVTWAWNNNKFIITSGCSPRLFSKLTYLMENGFTYNE